MANQQRKTGPERLGGAHPPSGGGYGDNDTSTQRRVGESDAHVANPQEPRELEGLFGMNPAAAVRPDNREGRPDEQIEPGQRQAEGGEPAGVSSDETDPGDIGDRINGYSLVCDGLDG